MHMAPENYKINKNFFTPKLNIITTAIPLNVLVLKLRHKIAK